MSVAVGEAKKLQRMQKQLLEQMRMTGYRPATIDLARRCATQAYQLVEAARIEVPPEHICGCSNPQTGPPTEMEQKQVVWAIGNGDTSYMGIRRATDIHKSRLKTVMAWMVDERLIYRAGTCDKYPDWAVVVPSAIRVDYRNGPPTPDEVALVTVALRRKCTTARGIHVRTGITRRRLLAVMAQMVDEGTIERAGTSNRQPDWRLVTAGIVPGDHGRAMPRPATRRRVAP